jgi:hypothetical protein
VQNTFSYDMGGVDVSKQSFLYLIGAVQVLVIYFLGYY